MGTDIFSVEKRSEVMSRVKSKNTGIEIQVRSALHKMGYRFRIHRKELPGIPDIVLPKYNTAIFVHGCFWHQHPSCKKATYPKQNPNFWKEKLSRNIKHDKQVEKDLKRLGWNVLTIWECEIKSKDFSNKIAVVSKQISSAIN